jgi:small nuclear ribonucleoprotein (snRNP)-like protein
MNMAEKRKSRDEELQRSDYLSNFINKIVVCETLSEKTVTGVLTEYNRYELILVETKDIKAKKPMKTVVFKHGLVSIREAE